MYTHLPEHTLQLSNMFVNEFKSINPKFIGYCHWFEVPQNAPYGDRAKSMTQHNIVFKCRYIINAR